MMSTTLDSRLRTLGATAILGVAVLMTLLLFQLDARAAVTAKMSDAIGGQESRTSEKMIGLTIAGQIEADKGMAHVGEQAADERIHTQSQCFRGPCRWVIIKVYPPYTCGNGLCWPYVERRDCEWTCVYFGE